MKHSIALIYGDQVVDDIDFCRKHDAVINGYYRALIRWEGASREVMKALARNPKTFPGWASLLEDRPEDEKILKEFLNRLIAYRDKIRRGRW
jgi:hypothetical protein